MDDLLFAKVNLPTFDKEQAIADIVALDSELWFWDTYRATKMVPFMTKGGTAGKESYYSNSKGERFEWLPYTPKGLRDWFDNHVFPWMGMPTRVMALMTQPHFENREHIDCDRHRMGTMQHKFRVVLKGKTDTLYYKTTKGNVWVPDVDTPFLMDGSWPHGMHNFTDDIKITIAAGAPWNGNPSYNNIEMCMKKSDYKMPADLEPFFSRPR